MPSKSQVFELLLGSSKNYPSPQRQKHEFSRKQKRYATSSKTKWHQCRSVLWESQKWSANLTSNYDDTDGNEYTDMGFLTIFGGWTGRASGWRWGRWGCFGRVNRRRRSTRFGRITSFFIVPQHVVLAELASWSGPSSWGQRWRWHPSVSFLFLRSVWENMLQTISVSVNKKRYTGRWGNWQSGCGNAWLPCFQALDLGNISLGGHEK